MELYSMAQWSWPSQGNQLLCQHDRDTVVLFRTCCEHLGPHIVSTGCFLGNSCYEKDSTRMMWFNTSFLVQMHRSAWGTKKVKEILLAIRVRRSFFQKCLAQAVYTFEVTSPSPTRSRKGSNARASDCVRLHWEPDRLPSGEKHRRRRVVQLGLKGDWLQRIASGEEIVHLERLDALMTLQRSVLASASPQGLYVPVERVFDPSHLEVC
ncbi:unnamed protein product, partial [Choristocarpus tenellus]